MSRLRESGAPAAPARQAAAARGAAPAWTHRHLTGIEGLSAADLRAVLDLARGEKAAFLAGAPDAALKGRRAALLFAEPSTRTRASFEVAARSLGAECLAFTLEGSSVLKGESLADTVGALEAMAVDFLVLRHPLSGAALSAAAASRVACVVNAGDGSREHPTQALLDLATLEERFGRIAGLRVLFVGDIAHSRVARSGIRALALLGATAAVCGPRTLLPPGIEALGCEVEPDLDAALARADAVVALRLQAERRQENLIPSLAEYRALWGLTRERWSALKKRPCVLHPGPLNRGVEIDSEVADGPESLILKQVANGVAVRRAVLKLLTLARQAAL